MTGTITMATDLINNWSEPTGQQDIVYVDLSTREIAELYSISPGTVQKRFDTLRRRNVALDNPPGQRRGRYLDASALRSPVKAKPDITKHDSMNVCGEVCQVPAGITIEALLELVEVIPDAADSIAELASALAERLVYDRARNRPRNRDTDGAQNRANQKPRTSFVSQSVNTRQTDSSDRARNLARKRTASEVRQLLSPITKATGETPKAIDFIAEALHDYSDAQVEQRVRELLDEHPGHRNMIGVLVNQAQDRPHLFKDTDTTVSSSAPSDVTAKKPPSRTLFTPITNQTERLPTMNTEALQQARQLLAKIDR